MSSLLDPDSTVEKGKGKFYNFITLAWNISKPKVCTTAILTGKAVKENMNFKHFQILTETVSSRICFLPIIGKPVGSKPSPALLFNFLLAKVL